MLADRSWEAKRDWVGMSRLSVDRANELQAAGVHGFTLLSLCEASEWGWCTLGGVKMDGYAAMT